MGDWKDGAGNSPRKDSGQLGGDKVGKVHSWKECSVLLSWSLTRFFAGRSWKTWHRRLRIGNGTRTESLKARWQNSQMRQNFQIKHIKGHWNPCVTNVSGWQISAALYGKLSNRGKLWQDSGFRLFKCIWQRNLGMICEHCSLWMWICSENFDFSVFLWSIDTIQGLWGQFFYLGNGKTSLDLEGNHCKVNFHSIFLCFLLSVFELWFFSPFGTFFSVEHSSKQNQLYFFLLHLSIG